MSFGLARAQHTSSPAQYPRITTMPHSLGSHTHLQSGSPCSRAPSVAAPCPRLQLHTRRHRRHHADGSLLHASAPYWKAARHSNGPRVVCAAAAPPAAQQEQQSSTAGGSREERLKQWVLEHGNQPTDLVPQVVDPVTRQLSMVTLAPVQQGQALVRVPRALLLTAERAGADPEYGPLVREGPLSEWQALVLALLCERARGDGSFFAPYLAVLPPQEDHPLAWGPERLAWLQGSSMHDTLTGRQQQVRDDCEVLQVLGANQLPLAQQWQQQTGEELVTVRSVTWAASILLSRAFSLDMAADDEEDDPVEAIGEVEEGEDADEEGEESTGSGGGGGLAEAMAVGWPQDVLALVPWADSLDHSSEAGPESCLRWNTTDQAASLLAHRAYEPGQRVFDSYGPELSPSHLLLDWGFVDPSNCNHRVELDPMRVVEPRSKQAKNVLAAMVTLTAGPQPSPQQGQQGSGVLVPVTCDGPDLTLLTWVRAALSTDAELIRAGWRVKAGGGDVELACRVMGRLAEPSSRDMEARVLAALHAHIEARLGLYPRAAVAMAAAAVAGEQQPGGSGASCRAEEAALLAMSSEAQALMGALAAVAECQRKLEAGCALGDLYLDLLPEDWEDEGEEEEAAEEEEVQPERVGRRRR